MGYCETLSSHIIVNTHCIRFLFHLTAVLVGNVVGTQIGQKSKTRDVVYHNSLHMLDIIISLLSIIKCRWQTISIIHF